MYNRFTGGCYDGLGESSININQGAESTISYLLARLSLDKANISSNALKIINPEEKVITDKQDLQNQN